MQKKRTFKIVIYTLLITVILFVSACSKKMPLSAFDNSCNNDNDCVSVGSVYPRNHCCYDCGEKAINKEAEAIRESWRIAHCKSFDLEFCPKTSCYILEKWTKPVCVENKCILIKIETIEECNNDPYCIADLAREKKDSQICETLRNMSCSQDAYAYCLMDIVNNNKTCIYVDSIFKKLCSEGQLNASDRKCYSALSFCSENGLRIFKAKCYAKVANSTEDCDKIPDINSTDPLDTFGRQKAQCYEKFAENREDCEKIKHFGIRNICMAKTAKNLRECFNVSKDSRDIYQYDSRYSCIYHNYKRPVSLKDCDYIYTTDKYNPAERMIEQCIEKAIINMSDYNCNIFTENKYAKKYCEITKKYKPGSTKRPTLI